MAHREQQIFCQWVRRRFPHFFEKVRALDVGSLDVNGNNRGYFEGCSYVGLDLAPGPNVDVVSPVHQYSAPEGSFDIVISTECLEHDQYFRESLQAMARLVRPGGMLLVTCATLGRGEHGTSMSQAFASPFTAAGTTRADYYRNLTEGDFRSALDIDDVFADHEFHIEQTNHDLHFWGIKRERINELRRLARAHGCDKIGPHVHRYTEIYDELLSSRRMDVRRVLEIGVQRGGSLRMWRDYFPRAEIIGLDVDPACSVHNGERIRVFIGPQDNRETLRGLVESAGGQFDLIIDDGGHRMHEQQIAVEELFPHVAPGGLFIIEDMHTSYWPAFNTQHSPRTIAYVQELAHDINYRWSRIPHPWTRVCDPAFFELLSNKAINFMELELESVQFHDGLCVLKRGRSRRFPEFERYFPIGPAALIDLAPPTARRIVHAGCVDDGLALAMKARWLCQMTGLFCEERGAASDIAGFDVVHVGPEATWAGAVGARSADVVFCTTANLLQDVGRFLDAARRWLDEHGKLVLIFPVEAASAMFASSTPPSAATMPDAIGVFLESRQWRCERSVRLPDASVAEWRFDTAPAGANLGGPIALVLTPMG